MPFNLRKLKNFIHVGAKICAAIFVLNTGLLLFITDIAACEWGEPLFGPHISCDMQFLSLIFTYTSVLSWWWIFLIMAVSFSGYFLWARILILLPLIIYNILVFKGLSLFLKNKKSTAIKNDKKKQNK